MKRVIATMFVPDDADTHDIALQIECHFPDSDPTVWTFDAFFDDCADGLVTRVHDGTISGGR